MAKLTSSMAISGNKIAVLVAVWSEVLDVSKAVSFA
jgi:hypothetical protein